MATRQPKKPDLYFGPSGTLEGFTSAGVQGFNELNPAAIVRELIQNSLDAVREDGREKAVVRFEIEKARVNDIPGIGTYRKAVKSATRDQKKILKGNFPDQAQMVVDAIESCLEEPKIEVLSVLDNGLGLDERRMTGLLSDGLSVKSSAASGAVGNGHLTAIPASDLRYVLYGGVSADGKKIASGHAILASFTNDKGQSVGKDGYYAVDVTDLLESPYRFPAGNDIAPLISKKLEWVKKNFESKTGAAVIIPGFNRFREENIDLWGVIQKAAACSFFAAIADEHLEIIFKDESGEKKLNDSNIKSVFSGALETERRAKNFLSGSRATEAYRTAVRGDKYSVDVGCGTVEVLVREVKEGLSHIDLCRNGMWITDKLPRLNRAKFSDRKPFHCLIKVKAGNGDIHELIRKSEGPLHNNIETQKWLKSEQRKQLLAAFNKISDFLSSKLEKLSEESFSVSELTIEGDGKVEEARSHYSSAGKYEEIQPRPPRTTSTGGESSGGKGSSGGSSGNGNSTVNAFKRSGNSVSFGAIPVPTGSRSYSVELHLEDEIGAADEAEIRFVLDESIDETCDLTNEENFVHLKKVMLDGKKVSPDRLIKSGDVVLGVCLNHAPAGQVQLLTFDYGLPDDVEVSQDSIVSLRAEMVRRRATQS